MMAIGDCSESGSRGTVEQKQDGRGCVVRRLEDSSQGDGATAQKVGGWGEESGVFFLKIREFCNFFSVHQHPF